MERFEEILWDLGKELDLPLHEDKHHACRIVVRESYAIQLELDPAQEKLLIGCLICEIPPGKYRENVLKDALRANHTIKILQGILCYVAQVNQLAIYSYVPARHLTGEKLAEYIGSFIEYIEEWKSAIESGGPGPVPNTEKKPNTSSRPFGL